MDLTDLLKMGASVIQGNSDEATTGLDTDAITDALGSLLGNGEGGVDLSSIISSMTSNSNLTEIVGSWLGNGENMPISMDLITDLLGSDKVSEFASSLGLSEESAKGALAEALPNVIDQATSGEGSVLDTMLEQVGGAKGAMDMLGKIFR